MHSDRYGLLRIVSQLIENAVKYGDGTGIRVRVTFCLILTLKYVIL